jgi:hypothetical protein
MGAYDFVTPAFLVHPDFIRHNIDKKLISNPHYQGDLKSTLWHIVKYVSYGYKIERSEFNKFIDVLYHENRQKTRKQWPTNPILSEPPRKLNLSDRNDYNSYGLLDDDDLPF